MQDYGACSGNAGAAFGACGGCVTVAAMAINLYNKATGEKLFAITEAERQELIDTLEEEHDADADYYLDADVLDFLAEKLSPDFLAKLQKIVPARASDDEPDNESDIINDAAGIEVEWREE